MSSLSLSQALDLATYPMSVMIACGGISAAVLGTTAARIGVRKAMAVGGVTFGAGFGLASVGVATHNLGLLYAGNFVCGVGFFVVV